jgi:translation initiation factor eIF-2B subunit alpha
VSSVGTYQVALVAKAMQKPFYALAESYKFLRHYPLSQIDLPMPRSEGGREPQPPLTFSNTIPPPKATLGKLEGAALPPATPAIEHNSEKGYIGEDGGRLEMTKEMEDLNPMVDITTPDLIDFIITDLGAPLSPTSVSQYLVAQFSS